MIATQSIERRLAKIEQKLIPRLTEIEAYLCDCPEFVQLIADCGLNVEELRQRGNIIGSLPRDLLVLIVDRLKSLKSNADGSNVYQVQ